MTERRRCNKKEILEVEYIDADILIRRGVYNDIMEKKIELKSLYRIFYAAHLEHHETLTEDVDMDDSDEYLMNVQRQYTVCLRRLNVKSDLLEANASSQDSTVCVSKINVHDNTLDTAGIVDAVCNLDTNSIVDFENTVNTDGRQDTRSTEDSDDNQDGDNGQDAASSGASVYA